MEEFIKLESKKRLIIAIDGPSGAGKSTVARYLAKRLGYMYIDTGAMYRALALRAKEESIEINDEKGLSRLALKIDIYFKNMDDKILIFCDGKEITESIRTPEISRMASEISKHHGVRKELVKKQRDMGKKGGVVLEGRDIGTVVFPDADIKFYLDASPEERGKRRFKELMEKGEKVSLEETINEVTQRDYNDMHRDHSPLRIAEDAIFIDSTFLSIEGVLEEMLKYISKLKEI